MIKKCAKKLRSECIKNQDHERKKSVEDFLILWEEEVPTLINKKALEDQINQKRQKKVVLPSKQDIKLLYDYLKKECNTCLEILNGGFNLNAWTLLTQCTLIFIQIFNRRRAGEIERLTVINYQNKEVLDEKIDQELYEQLSESTKEFAKQFARLVLRGKLGRTVSVLLSPLAVRYIETILKFRKRAGVHSDNEYIFSIPHTNSLSKKYLRACPLMRRFANECGALIPSTLRGTTLRKHIATYTSMLNVEECQVDRLANFMGHHKDIHKNVYRVPIPIAEMTDVSRLLMAAIGDGNKEDDESDDNQNSDSSDEENNNVTSAMIEHTNTNMDYTDTSTFDSKNTSASGSVNNSTNFRCRNSKIKKSLAIIFLAFYFYYGKIANFIIIKILIYLLSVLISVLLSEISASPFGKTKRSKWADQEKKAITAYFGNLDKLSKLPSLEECRKVILKYKMLNQRTPQQVKTWIDNQRRAKQRQQFYAKSKNLSF